MLYEVIVKLSIFCYIQIKTETIENKFKIDGKTTFIKLLYYYKREKTLHFLHIYHTRNKQWCFLFYKLIDVVEQQLQLIPKKMYT